MATFDKIQLVQLLEWTQRKMVVGMKESPQVNGCVIQCDGDVAITMNIVRDNMSGGAVFSIPCEANDATEDIWVASIEKLLGVLKAFGSEVTLEHDGKLRVRSKSKRATIDSPANAIVDGRTLNATQASFHERLGLAATAGEFGDTPFSFSFACSADDMFEALRMTTMVEKSSLEADRFTFSRCDDGLTVTTGSEGESGRMSVDVSGEFTVGSGTTFPDVIFYGGLHNALKGRHGDVNFEFYFSDGEPVDLLVIRFDNGDFLMQKSWRRSSDI